MEVTRSSETSVYNKPTRRHIPEDNIPHSHRRENLKSYIFTILTDEGEMQFALPPATVSSGLAGIGTWAFRTT
jgi:hypothetical protein